VWPVIGFAFFGKLEILLSVWVFYALFWTQSVIFNKVGYITNPSEPYCSRTPFTGYQSFGAMVVIVAVGLYLARRHIKNVIRQAIRPESGAVDDSREFVSSRTAVAGLLLATVYMVVWLYKSGMEPKVIAVFLPAALLIFLGITRGVVEGGLIWLRGPVLAQAATLTIVGGPTMRARSILSLFMTFGWHSDIKAFFMPAAAHSMRMAERMGLNRRRVTRVIALAAVVAYVVSMWYTMHICYKYGAYSFRIHIFRNGAMWPCKEARSVLAKREEYQNKLTDFERMEARAAVLRQVRDGASPDALLAGLRTQYEKTRRDPKWTRTFDKLADLRVLTDRLEAAEREKPDTPELRKAVADFKSAMKAIQGWKGEGVPLAHAERKLLAAMDKLQSAELADRNEQRQAELALVAATETIRDRENTWPIEKSLAVLEARQEALETLDREDRFAAPELAKVEKEIERLRPGLPQSRPWSNIFFIFVGGVVAAFVFAMRYAFPWWPIHPIGLAFAMCLPVEFTSFSIFLAWLAKTLIMRAGGVKLYNVAKLFFLGLIFGEFFISGMGFIVDLIFFNEFQIRHFMYGW